MLSFLDHCDELSHRKEKFLVELQPLAARFFVWKNVVTKFRLAMLRRALMRCATCITVLVALTCLGSCVIDACMRLAQTPSCQWHAVTNSGGAPYSARFCYLKKEIVLLRVYDSSGRSLLAERSFSELDQPYFYWEPNALGYNDREYDGDQITLPPGFIERMRAKLP